MGNVGNQWGIPQTSRAPLGPVKPELTRPVSVYIDGDKLNGVTDVEVDLVQDPREQRVKITTDGKKPYVPLANRAAAVPVSSPEMDRFLTAMLRAVGGTLLINPLDSVIGSNERVEVIQMSNGCYKYSLIEDSEPAPEPKGPPPPRRGYAWVDHDGTVWIANIDPVGYYTTSQDGRLVWMDRRRWDD